MQEPEDFDFETAPREEQIEYLASNGFSWREIAIFLREDARIYKQNHNNQNSIERLAYERGVLKTTIEINQALKDQAIDGNTNAMQIRDKQLLERQWAETFQDLANEGSFQ